MSHTKGLEHKVFLSSTTSVFQKKLDNELIPRVENAPSVDIIKSPDGKSSLVRFGQVVLSVALNNNTTTGELTNEV